MNTFSSSALIKARLFFSVSFLLLSPFIMASEVDIQDQKPALSVTSVAPFEEVWPITVVAYGELKAWQKMVISSRLGGYQIVELMAEVGDKVHKGQVLAKLDNSILATEESELVARSQIANSNLKRAEVMSDKNAISKQSLQMSVTEAEVADALLKRKRLQISFTEVRAPDDGVISERTAVLGSTPSVGQELFQLIRQDRIEWQGELTDKQLTEVKTGQAVTLRLSEAAIGNASIRTISPTFNEDTRLVTVYADVSANQHLYPGMYVQGDIHVGQSKALIIPLKSIVIRDGKHYVFTLKTTQGVGSVTSKQVRVGRRIGDNVEIIEGINTSDNIVYNGAGFLSDGDTVSVVESLDVRKSK